MSFDFELNRSSVSRELGSAWAALLPCHAGGMMRRNLQGRAVDIEINDLLDELTETGPFPVNVRESDALCAAIQQEFGDRSDIITILDEVLASRGILLVERADGQWVWKGIRLKRTA